MRTWRVGTFSMGASLLFLGVILLLSRMLGMKLMYIMTSWWPVILVVLGIEILVYLFLSRQEEKPFLKYDIVSILFVGIIGTIGIGFAVLSSIGILDRVDQFIDREVKTMELPIYSQEITDDVERVVVNTDNYPITVEGSKGKEVSTFGTYQGITGDSKKLMSKPEDYLLVHQKGDTLYVMVKNLSSETVGPFDNYRTMEATILVPNNVKLEVIGKNNEITMKPRSLTNDWNVESAASVSLHLDKKSDINISALGIEELVSQQNEWKITNEDKGSPNPDEEITDVSFEPKNATFKTGEGTHHINIQNTNRVSLNTAQ